MSLCDRTNCNDINTSSKIKIKLYASIFIVEDSMEDNWKIDRIDTTNVAKVFARELEGEPKTYFLQGEWGSGKTEYLKEVEKAMNGGRKHFERFKFVYLELWKPKSKASLAQNILETIHPILYWLKTLAYVALILMSVIASTYISASTIIPKQLSGKEKAWLVIFACLIIALITCYQNNFFDMNRMVMWIDKKSLQGKHLFRKVLIVDDFDRLDKEMQDELYLLFNQLNGQTRIIFVGDFNKISKNQNNYLSKIIDRQISLPVQLQSSNIVKLISNAIRKNIDNHRIQFTNLIIYTRNFDFDDIGELFIKEKKNARDANKYLSYVQNQLIFRGKLDKVCLNQELLIIYLYLFHQDEYNNLLSNPASAPGGKAKTEIEKIIDKILFENTSLKISFKQNPTVYFNDNLATYHSSMELDRIVKNKEELKSILYVENESDYIEVENYLNSWVAIIDYSDMAETAIEVVNSSKFEKSNNVLEFILRNYARQLYNNSLKTKKERSSDEFVISQFENIINKVHRRTKCKVSNGKKLYMYRELISIFKLEQFSNDKYAQKYFRRILEKLRSKSNFGKDAYDSEALLYRLGFNYKNEGNTKLFSGQLPTIESQAKTIEKLCDTEYLYFWSIYLGYPPESDTFIQVNNLLGYKKLIFSYKGKIYANYVLSRCRHILNNNLKWRN